MLQRFFSLVLLIAVLTSCSVPGSTVGVNNQGDTIVNAAATEGPVKALPVAQVQPAVDQPAVQPVEQEEVLPTSIPAPTATAKSTATQADTVKQAAQVPAAVGPDNFPEGVSPLTGLPVQKSANLSNQPALVSVTNFPVTARPQAGLSFSPFVYEMYIGEGMTRFLAVFYGDYPQKGNDAGIALADDRIGPVRSGRLPYESIRKLYNGFLVMASASPNVLTGLSGYTNVFGSDAGDINSALIPATKLEEIASNNPKRLQKDALGGLAFNSAAPEGGKTANMLWIPYNFVNQVIWRFDAASGAYLRYQDDADGKTFIQSTDRLNKQPLTYENVVVLFANHDAKRETLINIDLLYQDKMPALLFRDGKMYEIYWTTANGDYEKKTGLMRPMRFIDAQGKPFDLKPGQTWVEIVQSYTRYNETVDGTYMEMKVKNTPGSGNWAVHFFPTVAER